ncbi:hypothetical protein HID58_059315 [Brassica napus]|uniref:Uncharacterized protein n=1 Tax=Brassica napus TaxID=3708 RepID=A0ABQ7ZSJ5_BRANA|nr:hypothetical protein HID58_059315 [Brassica napus]
MKESRRVDQGIRRRAMIKSKISCLSNVYVGKEKAQESGSKVTSIICKVLFFEQLRLLQKSPDWPEIFRDAKPVPADESSQIPMAQQDVYGK